MKNIKISVKLIGGFSITALIIVLLGVVALNQQSKLNSSLESLGNNSVPALEHILIIKTEASFISKLMTSLLSPGLSKEMRVNVQKGLDESRARYGRSKEIFVGLRFMETVQKEWKAFDSSISRWVAINNEAVTLSDKLLTMDIVNPSLMRQHMMDFELAHNSLLAKLSALVMSGTKFDGGTDANGCSLGKWMNNMDTENPGIVAIVKELRPIHEKLHGHTKEIKDLMVEVEVFEAKSVYKKKVLPTSELVFDLVHKMMVISDEANANFAKMNQLLLIDATSSQSATFEAVDKIVSMAVKDVEETVVRGNSVAKTGAFIITGGIVMGTAFALILGFVLTKLITGPLFKGVDLAKAMSEGDLTQTMAVDQEDEIGVLAKSLNEMTANLREMFVEIRDGVGQVNNSSEQLLSISDTMSSGAESTASRSNQVAAAAEEMSANQDSVAAAMEQASTNVNMVAASAEEMSSTIGEIAENSEKAKTITSKAVDQASMASTRVNDLGVAADEINKVTETITEISEQTNLLALNATIEAARAGEAGKGFAVVANEIKDLAKGTADATQDIKEKIDQIQKATGITVKEINEISSVISDVDMIVTTIATAVEEQMATTREIAENVDQASLGIGEVNENVSQSSIVSTEISTEIAAVSQSAKEINTASSQVEDSAKSLSGVAESLRGMVSRFKL